MDIMNSLLCISKTTSSISTKEQNKNYYCMQLESLLFQMVFQAISKISVDLGAPLSSSRNRGQKGGSEDRGRRGGNYSK